MALNPSPTFDPNERIPNNPFYSLESWSVTGTQGPLITGSGLLINAATGTIQAAAGPNPPGTVTSVTAGTGIATIPATGITNTGSVSLATVSGLTPGSYSYATITVDTYGRVITAANSATPVQNITGIAPIQVSGASSSPSISIAPGSLTQPGAVQLRDDCNTPSTALALTANQGYVLQSQINVLASTLGNQFLAGTLNAATGNVVTATIAGNIAGVTAGNPLPAPSSTIPGPQGNLGAEVIVTTANPAYSPTGGGGPYNVVSGDKFISDGATWVYLATGFRAPYATTTSSGVVELADAIETQALTDFTLAVTPGTLGTLTASTTQRGLVELADVTETQGLASSTVAVTPAGLGNLNASTTNKGLVQLINVLGSGSTTLAPTAGLLDQLAGNMIPKTIIDNTGDLIVGQTADTPAILPKGPNGSVLTVDATKPLGLDWAVAGTPDSVPVGVVMWFTSNDPANLPVGYVVCDGASYSALPEISPGVPNPFYDLFTVIGYSFGGAGASFNVPNLGGQFIRGFDSTGTVDDPARTFGSSQADAFQQHTHTTDPHNHTTPDHTHTTLGHGHDIEWNNIKYPRAIGGIGDPETTLLIGNWDPANPDFQPFNPTPINTGLTDTNLVAVVINNASVTVNNETVTVNDAPATAPTPDETRPKNVALLPIIKYTASP